MWDPASYLRYDDERSRPFHDLTARIAADHPRVVVDLGCGPGHLTATLPGRWPTARVIGLDSSAEMIESATALDGSAQELDGTPPGASAVEFTVADVRTWVPDAEVDVVISNAVLQWVPGHEALLVRWARALAPGSWLAVQVPGNFAAPSHRALYATAGEPRWRGLVDRVLRDAPVSDAVGYADLLTGADCQVDAWETTYVHLLPASGDADHPVLTWMEGTALRPVRVALGGGGAAWEAFRTDLGERLAQAYPIRDGLVYYPFHRVFFVARTGARQ